MGHDDSASTAASPEESTACSVAMGELAPIDEYVRVRAAHKDYSARGSCREHWFRFLWDGGVWTYDWADSRLGSVGRLASERHETTRGRVRVGDLLAQHDRGGKVDVVYLVTNLGKDPFATCDFVRRTGVLRITLPDGRKLERPDPRK